MHFVRFCSKYYSCLLLVKVLKLRWQTLKASFSFHRKKISDCLKLGFKAEKIISYFRKCTLITTFKYRILRAVIVIFTQSFSYANKSFTSSHHISSSLVLFLKFEHKCFRVYTSNICLQLFNISYLTVRLFYKVSPQIKLPG